jgi:outer membrane lipoprotein LolB
MSPCTGLRRLCRGALRGIMLVSLTACVSRGPRVEAPAKLTDPEALAAAQAQQAVRESWLRTHDHWAFEGRVAINNNGKGGNGRIDWRQEGDRYVVSLSAPVTRQSWRLIGDARSGAARLEGLQGGTREGDDAERLLREATGWEIPVQALTRWAQGMQGPAASADQIDFAADGRLRGVQESGWRIDYPLWFEPQDGRPALPRQIAAVREGAKVRLIIDRWDFGSP